MWLCGIQNNSTKKTYCCNSTEPGCSEVWAGEGAGCGAGCDAAAGADDDDAGEGAGCGAGCGAAAGADDDDAAADPEARPMPHSPRFKSANRDPDDPEDLEGAEGTDGADG